MDVDLNCTIVAFRNVYHSFPVRILVYGFFLEGFSFLYFMFLSLSFYIFIELFLKLYNIMTEPLLF